MNDDRIKKALDIIKDMNQTEKGTVLSELLSNLDAESDDAVEAAWQAEAQLRLREIANGLELFAASIAYQGIRELRGKVKFSLTSRQMRLDRE